MGTLTIFCAILCVFCLCAALPVKPTPDYFPYSCRNISNILAPDIRISNFVSVQVVEQYICRSISNISVLVSDRFTEISAEEYVFTCQTSLNNINEFVIKC